MLDVEFMSTLGWLEQLALDAGIDAMFLQDLRSCTGAVDAHPKINSRCKIFVEVVW